MKSKSLAKFTFIDGILILINVNKRIKTKGWYYDIKELLEDFPLNQFDIKIVQSDKDNPTLVRPPLF